MTKQPLSLSVFFPCYNEEANVERTTQAALDACRPLASDLEVIIVNDGSRDRTGEIADRLAAEHPEVRAVHNSPNRGYGGALQAGIRAATREWIFYTDGDGQFDLGEIGKVLDLKDPSTVVAGYRLDRKDPWLRKLNAFCWTTLVSTMFSLRVRDIDCAFKLFPRKMFERMELRSTGALIDTEILARAQRMGYGITQVGVHHYPAHGGEQTGANPRVIARAFKELAMLWPHIRRTTPRARSHSQS